MKNWYKYLSVLLMIYVIIAGFLIPLKPGIQSFSPSKITIDPDKSSYLKIKTYNTHFQDAQQNKVWLKLPNDQLLRDEKVTILSQNELEVSFYIPSTLPDFNPQQDALTLIVENEIDGYTFYPDAVRVNDVSGLMTNRNEYHDISKINQVESFKFPYRHILHETIRNTFFHVAIWFAMFILLIYSCYHSLVYLRSKSLVSDKKSASATTVALVFGIAGILTGSMWAKYTWGTFWTTDIKLNMSATAMLVYCAYWFLRASVSDIDTRARLSAVYNLFSFVTLMILVMVIPRFTDSLHPGNGGNPALGGEDLDNTLRAVFYPAIIGYTLIGFWISNIYFRYLTLKEKVELI